MEGLSPKQILSYEDSTARLNIWQGAVRSGKTFSSIIKLIKLLRDGPHGDAMIIGVSRDTIQRNVLPDLCSLLGYPMPGSKTNSINILGRTTYLVGASDESAVRRIQGSTLALAYVDEATNIPKTFFKMLLSRLSVTGAQLLSTCNPEGPAHWLKKEFLDNKDKLDLKTWKFELDDNPVLSEAYKSNLKKEYSGAWYDRYILGKWAMAEGIVYDGFDEDNLYEDDFEPPSYRIAGVDYGIRNPTACSVIGVSQKWPQLRLEKEYYYDSVKEGRQKSDAELADDIQAFLLTTPVEYLYIDPSAASLKIELSRRDLPVIDAKNDVLSGIAVMSKFINQKNLVVNKKCKNFLEEVYSYCWDSKASDKGVDKVVKENDHILDATRYNLYSHFPDGELDHPDNNMSIEEIQRRVYGTDNFLGGMSGGEAYL